VSTFILDELKDKLVHKFGFSSTEANRVVRLVKSRSTTVKPGKLSAPVCRDPDDDNVIGTAVAGCCDCIVSGDKDLTDLETAAEIPVVAPSGFWEFERAGD
jgi:putative PIN family toxin of toxin-antitoxin system